MAEAKAALDASLALRMAAAAVGTSNPKSAKELIERAEKLYFGEDLDKASADADGIKQWEALHGGSMSDPEVRDRVYAVAAKYRKMEAERNVEATKQREARIRLTADNQRRAQERLRRNAPRGRPS